MKKIYFMGLSIITIFSCQTIKSTDKIDIEKYYFNAIENINQIILEDENINDNLNDIIYKEMINRILLNDYEAALKLWPDFEKNITENSIKWAINSYLLSNTDNLRKTLEVARRLFYLDFTNEEIKNDLGKVKVQNERYTTLQKLFSNETICYIIIAEYYKNIEKNIDKCLTWYEKAYREKSNSYIAYTIGQYAK